MPLVPALCTQCGAKMEIDSSKDAAICPFCNTPFVTEKAINNYNTTNVTNIGNLHADVVNVSDDQSRDNRVRSGETFLKLQDYDAAQNVFGDLAEDCPYDYRGWWGLIKVYSKSFTDYDISLTKLNEIKSLYDKAYAVATDEEKEILKSSEYINYYEKLNEKLNNLISKINKEIEKCSKEFESIKNDLDSRISVVKCRENRIGITFGCLMIGSLTCSLFILLVSCVSSIGINKSSLIPILVILVIVTMIGAVYAFVLNELKHERISLESKLNDATNEYNTNIAPLLEQKKTIE